MNLNFGISTMVYYHEVIEKLLPYLDDADIRNIEIRPHMGHFECQDPELIDKLKKRIETFNISVKSVHMPMNGVDISHPEEYDRVRSIREIEKAMMVALKLNAELVVIHPGGKYNNSDDRKIRLNHCVSSLKEIAEFGEQWNIKIALENTLPGRLGDRWTEIQQIIEKISSEHLGICLDTGHYFLNQPDNEKGNLTLDKEPINWQKNLLHIHVHDNNGKEDLHLLPEEGLFPWISLISYLKIIKYDGALIIEPKAQEVQLPDYLDKVRNTFERLGYFWTI